MKPYFIMHRSTWEYLKEQVNSGKRPVDKMKYNGDWAFMGYNVVLENSLQPTINEGTKYIFPKEPFVTYEQSDAEWCEYFGIGRKGRGLIFGEVYACEPQPHNVTPTKNRVTVRDPFSKTGFIYT
jgi:hypothetical protein